MYMLDANIVSDMIRNPHGVVTRRVAMVGESRVVTSIIVAAELRFGAVRRQSQKLNIQMERVFSVLPIQPLDGDADWRYAHIRANLERRGLPIGANDLLIAAHALSLGATLVTDNTREFARVDGLTIENWLRD